MRKTITKQEIYHKEIDSAKRGRALSLPLSVLVALVFGWPALFPNNLPTAIIILSGIFSCSSLVVGIYLFIVSLNRCKYPDKTKFVFYERRLLKKPTVARGVDESDDYVYEFEEFGTHKENAADLGFYDADAGDAYLLVCYKSSKSIAQIYSLKHWEPDQEILEEIN